MGIPTNRRRLHFLNHLSRNLDFTVIKVPILNSGCRFKSGSVSDGESDICVDTAQTEL